MVAMYACRAMEESEQRKLRNRSPSVFRDLQNRTPLVSHRACWNPRTLRASLSMRALPCLCQHYAVMYNRAACIAPLVKAGHHLEDRDSVECSC
jgi:hypothetical protein